LTAIECSEEATEEYLAEEEEESIGFGARTPLITASRI
jgi:hypothetical protein